MKWIVVLIASLGAQSALAQESLFTADEIRRHGQQLDQIVAVSAACLDRTYADHVEFFDRHGVSRYYGNRRTQHQTREGLIGELLRFGKPATLVSELKPISCIGLTLNCLGEGFRTAGLGTTWSKIHARLAVDQKFYGTDLQGLLRELGWKLVYWNPNPAKNKDWDAEDLRLNPLAPGRSWNPVWGGHEYRYATIKTKGNYYGLTIDDSQWLVGFGDRVPADFARVPFFVGTAHAGYHVFPGRQGEVIEAHSTRLLNSRDNLEFSVFNPLGTGGGPRWTKTEKYRSGVIAIPGRR